ncbi:unnamed protein product [Toxocara canis]|uniref:Uncharacterized protein n=1 Tax=Toxocara canis TaxID=6265 RepID=A0A183TZR8_TOXCA|nr:unnamed protein product [Toxocara canis]
MIAVFICTTGVGRNREAIKSSNDWKYAEEPKAGVAPLARSEVDDREERQTNVPKSTGRASAALQNLREDDGAHSENENSGTLRKTPNRSLGSLGRPAKFTLTGNSVVLEKL